MLRLDPDTQPAFSRTTKTKMLPLLFASCLAANTASAVIDNSITQGIWRLKYGVTEAQMADSNWLDGDADGDGVKNKDEVAAGTNPFSAGSVVKIKSITIDGSGNVSLVFPTETDKQYVVQGATSLPTFASIGVTWVGTGGDKTLTFAKGGNKFFRVLVQDLDTDGDGAADWAETVAGYNKNSSTSHGTTNDKDSLTAAIPGSNVITVKVTKSSARQPSDSTSAPVETGSITISRGGSLKFNTLVVPIQKSGTAVEGTDYDGLVSSVTFSGKTTDVVLAVNPKYNTARKSNVTAIVQVLEGSGYTLGASNSGAVVINPAGLALGTGLTGQYHNESSTSYATNQTVFNGAAEMTRVDATIDFNGIASMALGSPCTVTTNAAHGLTTGDSITIAGVVGGSFSPALVNGAVATTATVTGPTTFTIPLNCIVVPTSLLTASVLGTNGPNGWGRVGGPTGMTPPSASTAFSVRWTGKVLPQYSETYYFDFRSDDSAKVWVDGKLLIDRWQSQGSAEFVNSITLKAGVLYDIQIDYLNISGNAEARLYWWSSSQVKQIIPQSRLFPAAPVANQATHITSSVSAVGYTGEPFYYKLLTAAINGAVTYAVDPTSGPLPPGLALNSATGEITGTPTTAGAYNVAVNATNVAAGTVTGSSVIDFTIYPTGAVTREKGAGYATADGTIPVLDDDTEYPNNTLRRLRGYIVPPKTGNYYFWLAASNKAELWISTDSQYVNRAKRATVTASTGKKTWNAQATQRTSWLKLTAGQKYYFDVLHDTGIDADDYVNVGWCQDDVGTRIATSADPNPNGDLTTIPNGGAALPGYPYSGTVPGYLCQPYDYPALAPATGSLYAANLGPQADAVTQASGSANIRVNAAGTQATLYFNYQNLTTARTQYHLHVDGYVDGGNVTHTQGEIVFDLDDVDSFHPELKTADGGYIWNFDALGSFLNPGSDTLLGALQKGKVYLNIHSAMKPGGEIRGTLNLVEGSQTPPDASQYPAPSFTDDHGTDAGAARFLNQATYGASPTDVAYVKANGFSAWIDDQLTKPVSRTSGDVVAGITADINTPYPSTLFTDAWWKYSITGADQLRQRLAFALSEILVVSWANNTGPLQNNGRILADYYDNLVDYCLPTSGVTNSGNFRGILKAVTLTPAMGLYLDMRGNEKGDDTVGRHPNENYAREIMQLFSVGLNRTWDDGKFVLDSTGSVVPTYTQPNIIGLSALLTGWNYAQANQSNGRAPTNFGPGADYLNPMVLVPSRHELASKLLLNNAMSPAATGQTPRVIIASIGTGSPCTITTNTAHGLTTGDTIVIAGVNSGTFAGGYPAINATFQATVTSPTAFTVPVTCSAAAGLGGTVTGATITPATYGTGGMLPVSGSQADNGVAAYDQYGLNELDLAIDNIVANDNVGPYICRQLIQRFVTSDPSPGYLYRVVQKFKDNGSGVRGDMAAVIRQILLDGEARGNPAATGNPPSTANFGKQREPMLRLTGPARAFPAAGYPGASYTQLTGVNAHKLRIVTGSANDFSSSFNVSLDFRGNYSPANQTLTPGNVPTSTTYAVQATLPIAATHLDISSIGTGNPTVITCAKPHGLGLSGTKTVWPTGLCGVFSATINTGVTATMTGANTFTLPINTTKVFQIASIAVGTPCVVTTTAPHGLAAGDTSGVTINGVTGGTFSGGATSINGTTFTVTNTGTNTFTVKVGTNNVTCSVAPTGYTTWRQCSNPCLVTTQVPHGLTTGDSVTFANISGGSFTPALNGSTAFPVTVVDSTSFTVASSCAVHSTPNTGNIVGGNTLDVNATGMVNATYSQAAGSTTMTVNTAGPQTDVVVPGTGGATIKSKVYLTVLSRSSSLALTSMAINTNPVQITKAGHGLSSGDTVTISGVTGGSFSSNGFTGVGAINKTHTVTVIDANTFSVPVALGATAPTAAGTAVGTFGSQAADGIYVVQTTPTGSSFTVTTADTPTAARSGNVLIPKIPTSYSPIGGGLVQYNTNVNHNLSVGTQIWVDVPVIGTPVYDAEYTIASMTDEDHFRTSNQPTNLNGGTYPTPSGSTNSVNIWPLVPAPTGRSGTVNVNQSTFVLGSTESTLTQSPLNAPTVFNFFFPDYKFPGSLSNTGLDSPEFQLTTDTNVMNLTNSLTNMFLSTGGGNGNLNGLSSFNAGGGSVVLDIGNYMTDAKTADGGIPGLIDELSNLLVGGPLQAATKTAIINFVTGRKISGISTGNPCTITTSGDHVLKTGDSVTIAGVTGGTFSPAINGTYTVTVPVGSTTTFTVPVNCTSISGLNLTNAYAPQNLPYTAGSNQLKRDRVRAIIHLIVTSAEYAVQK
ncbi:MAG: DUF1800 family protein [Verrucomicrobiaceae bacterium]|nr:DUF1800 family protein [Verrucomicrobiaceae bacterium]